MIDNHQAGNTGELDSSPFPHGTCSRRTFARQVIAGSGFLAALSRPALSRESGMKPPPKSGADVGSLYEDIMKMANAGSYPMSSLHHDYKDASEYRKAVQAKVLELFHYNPPPTDPKPEVVERWETPHFVRETVLFNTTPWFRIPAYVLIPKHVSGRRPAIVDLHCHAGSFVFGKEKLMPMRDPHAALVELKRRVFDGRSTSEELAKRGYVVISIDRFYFGERRSIFDGMNLPGMSLENYSDDQVRQANRRAGQGESTLVKSLFWAGTTWHGIASWDDIRTIDYLVTRSDVDSDRIGCMGISMGGDRTNYLCALDDRIQCAVSVGWMASLRQLIKSHVDTHSFSHFLPGLTRFMDLPDLLGAFTPKPLMVQQCSQDGLYTLESMKDACGKIEKVYQKADAAGKYRQRFYDQPHRFSLQMQEDAFDWLDRHLQA